MRFCAAKVSIFFPRWKSTSDKYKRYFFICTNFHLIFKKLYF